MQRIQLDQSLKEGGRLSVLAARLQPPREGIDRLEVEGSQSVAMRLDPVVIDPRDKVAGVEVDGRPQTTDVTSTPTLDRRLELGDVESKRPVGAPPERAALEVEEPLWLEQRAAQHVQLTAQVGQCLRVARLRPQGKRDLLPRPDAAPG